MVVEVSPGLLDSFTRASSALSHWSRQYRGTFGVAGSVAAGSAEPDSDIDLLAMIAPPGQGGGELPSVPSGFSDSGWQDFWHLYAAGQAHVFGTSSEASDQIHLEVYPFPVARKILQLEQFLVKRIKDGPILPTRALFHGIDRKVREQQIVPQARNGKIFSDLYSVIWDECEFFCGPHFERLLLAVLLLENRKIETLREHAWNHLAVLMARAMRDDLAGRDPEGLFFVSGKMSPEVRAEVRRRLCRYQKSEIHNV